MVRGLTVVDVEPATRGGGVIGDTRRLGATVVAVGVVSPAAPSTCPILTSKPATRRSNVEMRARVRTPRSVDAARWRSNVATF